MNKIISITKMENDFEFGWDGYIIETEKDTYKLLVDNYPQCCERWGYISSDDDFDKFIGQELAKIEIVDLNYNKQTISKMLKEKGVYSGDCVFVNLTTIDGDELVFAVYNSHNGYYGHTIWFVKNDIVNEFYK